jgi:hypothetical protein
MIRELLSLGTYRRAATTGSHPRRRARDSHQHVRMQSIKPSRRRHAATLRGGKR